jgi:DNA-directed RNA polymerase subunit M/transcription elongation factor TFIIS
MRKIGKTLVPEDVEAAVYNMYGNDREYATKIRYIATWSKALGITASVAHVRWDDDMWRIGTTVSKEWEEVRRKARPKQAVQIVFKRPTLLQCPACRKNMVNIDKMVQKRGCDEPATIYASCKNPACRKRLGREHRFRTEG